MKKIHKNRFDFICTSRIYKSGDMTETGKWGILYYKIPIIFLLSLLTVLSTQDVSVASYTITQITKNSYNDAGPQINENGWFTWVGFDGNDYEIFLYNGTTTTQITNNNYDDFNPHINDDGWITWSVDDSNDYEIFLYNGTTTTQITNNNYDDFNPHYKR